MKLKKGFFFVVIIFSSLALKAQLKPGFDAQEYLELLRISRQQIDTVIKNDRVGKPRNYRMVYRSKVGPLKNRWDLWINNDKTAVISLRGTTAEGVSWLENLYAAMVPASGQLHISNTYTFNYHLADDPRATIHVGWLLGMADMAPNIVEEINKLYHEQGIKNFLLMGHSQGGAIAYLLRSHLAALQQQQVLPADITFKTYCSAPPKPGNTYYAYSYDYLTRGGWGLSVINAADWVPETPFSIQTLDDFNRLNPFSDVSRLTKGQSFIKKIVIKYLYNQLGKPPAKAVKRDRKYLGHTVYKYIRKELPQLQEPVYAENNLYTHCGTIIMLMPDAAYRQRYPDNPDKLFTHHLFSPYYELAEREYGR
ncbi:lipase family protein [Mucilaginibacter sp.]